MAMPGSGRVVLHLLDQAPAVAHFSVESAQPLSAGS